MWYVTALTSILCGALLVPPAAAQAAPEQVVARFFPERLLEGSERYACHQVLAEQDGAPTLIAAAYTNRTDGAVRLLRRGADGTFRAVFDNPATWALSGRDCVLRLDDVDVDGTPEVFVYFFSTRSATGWIFRQAGDALVNLTAIEEADGRVVSRMLEPTVYDLFHEGSRRVVATREVPATAPGVSPRYPAFVYALRPEGFVVESTALAVMGFRADVGAGANQRFFRLAVDSAGPYTLRAINGARDGSARVGGATVTVNNVVVLGPDALNAATEFAETELVEVFLTNEVNAELTGDPDGRLILLVEDATER